jgi:hypothetical protein
MSCYHALSEMLHACIANDRRLAEQIRLDEFAQDSACSIDMHGTRAVAGSGRGRDAEKARAVPTTFIVGHRRLPAARRPKKEQKVVQPTQKQRPHLKRNTKARLSQSDMALIALPT